MSITKLTTNGLTGSKYDTASADNYYMEPIATQLVGSGGTSTITFSNIPSTYKHLQLRAINAKSGGASDAIYVRFNSDSGSNYSQHRIYGDGSSATAYGASSTTAALELVCMGTSSTNFGTFVLDALDYGNINKYKTVRALAGQDKSGSGQIMLGSGAWLNTSAITSITLTGSSATIAEFSRFSLYGIRG
jgi:hypothetical protein